MFVAIILGVLVSQTKAYSPAATCAITQNGFIANPLDCKGYYYCQEGQVTSGGTCPGDFVYNLYTGQCDYASNYKCPFEANLCGSLRKSYRSDPDSCTQYIYCDEKGVALYNECPNGQVFNPSTTSCIWGGIDSCPGSNKCELVQNNNFVAGDVKTENGETLYYSITCYNGMETTPHACPGGYYFNAYSGECLYNYDQKASPNCVPASTDNKNGAVQSGENYFAADPNNCNSYWYCNGGTATQQLFCPSGFHFDAKTGVCRYSWDYIPAGANERCDRCGGYPAGSYVALKNSSCKQYLYCLKDKTDSITAGSCPSTYPYFNEQTQNCVAGTSTGLGLTICTTPPAGN